MKSKSRKTIDDAEVAKRRVALRLEGLKGKALERELELAVARVEAEMGIKLPRYKGPMATPQRLRKAQ